MRRQVAVLAMLAYFLAETADPIAGGAAGR